MIHAVLFDTDQTLLDRSHQSLNHFLHEQYMHDQPHFAPLSADTFCKRFVALNQRGSVHKSVVYRELLQEFSVRGY